MNFGVKFFTGIVLASLLAGCGPQTKPEALLQLEEMRNSEEAAAINASAPEVFSKCTEFNAKAVDAWQDGEMAQANLYAELGQRQYATARAMSEMKDAQARYVTSETEIKSLTNRMETLNARREGLEKSIDVMKVSLASNSLANVEQRIQIAMTERERAIGIEADKTQKAAFDQAEAKLKEAGKLNAAGKREAAGGAAETARQMFAKAYDLAKPEFDKKQAAAKNAERQKALFTEAQQIVGPTYVTTDIRSTVIILAGAFEMNSSEIQPIKLDALRRIADLTKKYADATIIIEGHAQKRTKNSFEVSQRRCDTVRDFLVTQGVDYRRIMTTAKSNEVQRYNEKSKDNRVLNDRVEISLTLQQ